MNGQTEHHELLARLSSYESSVAELNAALTRHAGAKMCHERERTLESRLALLEAENALVVRRNLERILDGMVYELYLPDELYKADRHIIKHVEAAHLPPLEDIQGDKLAALQSIFERLYAKDHPVRKNLYFFDSIEAVRIIEGKAANGKTEAKAGA